MKILLLTLLVVIFSQPVFALGVSEESVTKWSISKLCEQQAKYLKKHDDKKIQILANEISRRNLDTVTCDQIGNEWLAKHTPKNEKRLLPLDAQEEKALQDAFQLAYVKYGTQLNVFNLGTACENTIVERLKPNWNVISADILGFLSRKYSYLDSLLLNRMQVYYEGYLSGVKLLAKHDPGLCTNEKLSGLIDKVDQSLLRKQVVGLKPTYIHNNLAKTYEGTFGWHGSDTKDRVSITIADLSFDADGNAIAVGTGDYKGERADEHIEFRFQITPGTRRFEMWETNLQDGFVSLTEGSHVGTISGDLKTIKAVWTTKRIESAEVGKGDLLLWAK
jgi:hypothetical protein